MIVPILSSTGCIFFGIWLWIGAYHNANGGSPGNTLAGTLILSAIGSFVLVIGVATIVKFVATCGS